jgi:hypothetical protein
MYAFVNDVAGYPQVDQVVAAPTNLRDLNVQAGMIASVVDPIWGPGELVFARAGGSIRLGGLCMPLPVWDATNQVFQWNIIEVTNVTLLGRPGYIYMGNTALTVGQYGWFMTAGVAPVNSAASVAIGVAIGIGAAGQASTLAAGKALLNCTVVQAATATVVKAGTGVSGDNVIYLPSGTQGMFAGQYASGTGVGAAAIVSAVYPDRVTVTVVNSATVTGNVTMTNNNATIFYNTVHVNRLMLQGPIT